MEVIVQILEALPVYLIAICQVVGAVAGIATIIVRITPSTKDDKIVGKCIKGILKVMSYLPTIGINPETKKMKEDLKSLKR